MMIHVFDSVPVERAKDDLKSKAEDLAERYFLELSDELQ